MVREPSEENPFAAPTSDEHLPAEHPLTQVSIPRSLILASVLGTVYPLLFLFFVVSHGLELDGKRLGTTFLIMLAGIGGGLLVAGRRRIDTKAAIWSTQRIHNRGKSKVGKRHC